MANPSATAVPPVAATAAATPRSPDVATEVATQPAAAGAVWWEVYFSPALHLSTSEELQYNQEIPAANFQGSITEKLVQRIDSAQKTIHIASFEMDLSDIDNALVIQSPELAAIYERQFEDMWSGKFNAKSPSTVDQQSLTIDGTPIQILFSPEDSAVSHIIPYVQHAQTSIEFMAFTYTQDQLGDAMIERQKNGVGVRGGFESTGSDTEVSEMQPLFCAKAAVRQDGNPAFMHHKVIIIDGHIVITGSLNFTDNADQQNNENVLIIDNAEIAKLYTQEFQRVWDAGHNPDPEKMKCK